MKTFFGSIVVAAVLAFAAPASVSAVTFSPSINNVVDFGDVVVGDSKTISWSISWTLDPGEMTSLGTLTAGLSDPPFLMVSTTNQCFSEGFACVYDLTFSPAATGVSTAANTLLFMHNGETFTLELQGTGIAALVPLPASLPFLAIGLFVLGLAGWTPRRTSGAQ